MFSSRLSSTRFTYQFLHTPAETSDSMYSVKQVVSVIKNAIIEMTTSSQEPDRQFLSMNLRIT